MSDGPKFIINSADVPATARLRFRFTTDNCVIPGGSVKIESHDGTRWHVVPDETATVTTTCARCSAMIDPAAVEQHHAVCFRVGDHVRISRPADVAGGGWWVEGELLSMDRNATDGFDGRIRVSDASLERKKYVGTERSFSWGNTNTIRHIQRPGQAVREQAQIERERFAMALRDLRDTRALEPSGPTLYDGLTAEQCLERWQRRQREDGAMPFAGQVHYPTRDTVLTAGQLAAARELWSLHLKQRISAAKERERLTVRADLQDEE